MSEEELRKAWQMAEYGATFECLPMAVRDMILALVTEIERLQEENEETKARRICRDSSSKKHAIKNVVEVIPGFDHSKIMSLPEYVALP